MSSQQRRCAVYRYFDSSGVLLYVGSSVAPDGRDWCHRRSAKWVPLAVKRTVEWYGSIPEARAAERDALISENPIHNERFPYQPLPLRAEEVNSRVYLCDGIYLDESTGEYSST